MAHAILGSRIPYRYILDRSGVMRRLKRDPYILPGCPRADRVFIWGESRSRYIVAFSTETRKIDGRHYGCYHIVGSKKAAIMLAHAIGVA